LSTKGVTGVVKGAITGIFQKPKAKPKRRTSGNGYTVRKL
jgi:hypothetical protein